MKRVALSLALEYFYNNTKYCERMMGLHLRSFHDGYLIYRHTLKADDKWMSFSLTSINESIWGNSVIGQEKLLLNNFKDI